MFKFIWFCLMGCLIIGILFMGNVILESVTDTSEEMKRVQTEVKAKVQDLKEGVMEKKAAMGEMLKDLKGSRHDQKVLPSVEAKPASVPQTAEKPEPKKGIDPVDEEDRRLTAEIIGSGSGSEKTLERPQQEPLGTLKAQEMGRSATLQTEAEEKFDLDRMATIREIYRQAIETLDSK